MRGIENQQIVLSLNKLWQAICVKSVKEAVIDMCGGGESPPAFGLDIEYATDEEGNYVFDKPIKITPTLWGDWINLPIRDCDFVIHSSKRAIRVPTVIVSANYALMPKKTTKWSREAVRKRDNDTCQITGIKLKRGEGNIDHIIPKDKGGKDNFQNTVYVKKELNSEKGNRFNHQVGFKLLRQPRAPLPVSVCATIKEIKHRDWKHFMTVKEMEVV